ncbi:MAG: NfeD family protein [Calditrichaeota bacterium]|nr:MAG: NfeD family protein [Calditrichota bacterium]
MSIWILWMILAAVFLVAEIFTAGFFLMWFGIGAAVAGLLALFGVGFGWQLAAFIVVSLFLFIMTRQITAKMVQEQPPGIGADRLLDQEVMVIEEINHLENRGRIRLKGEEWRAESLDHSTIPAGTTVKVVRVSGTRLIVQ